MLIAPPAALQPEALEGAANLSAPPKKALILSFAAFELILFVVEQAFLGDLARASAAGCVAELCVASSCPDKISVNPPLRNCWDVVALSVGEGEFS